MNHSVSRLVPAATLALSLAGVARAGIVLEFFRGNTLNDLNLNTLSPLASLTLVPSGAPAFVQVALHQTAPTSVLNSANGISSFLIQGDYGGGYTGVFYIPGTTTASNLPICSGGVPTVYNLVRSFRSGLNGSAAGTNQSAATGFRLGGLNLNAPPSPSVDANGRFFLGTFQVNPISAGTSSIVFTDPNPAPTNDNNTDNAGSIDSILFNGATYTLPIIVHGADFDGDGVLSVADIFKFLSAWFAGIP